MKYKMIEKLIDDGEEREDNYEGEMIESPEKVKKEIYTIVKNMADT